jgi:hypothetical protein
VVILNPHNGPGAGHFPDANYAREIARLNACANVCTVGYVCINYCKRAIGDVCRDVNRYAGWSVDYGRSKLGVQGIFFDETPNLYSNHVVAYLNAIDRMVKEARGVVGEQLVSKFQANSKHQAHKSRRETTFPSSPFGSLSLTQHVVTGKFR